MAYRSKPVVIDGEEDEDAKRVMSPERQQGYLDALTELSKQWGIRIRDMQTTADVVLTPIEHGLYGRDGHYTLTGPPGDRRINWLPNYKDGW